MSELVVTYRLRCADGTEAEELALAIAREQTVEVPPGVGGHEVQERVLGRVRGVRAVERPGFDAVISYPAGATGSELVQTLNVAYGNVSLMDGVRVVDLTLPEALLRSLPGPRFGIPGLRDLVGADDDRPLISVAIKPLGLGSRALGDLADRYVRGGADVIKDDHGLTDQPSSKFHERVEVVAAAVASANAACGSRTAYFPNVTGSVDGLEARLDRVEAAGCRGVMICPGLMGLDVVRVIASGARPLAIMAHPAHSQTSPGRLEGIAPEVLYGTLYRAVGADIVVYVNAGGRFAWPVESCEAINERLRGPLGDHRPAMPAPAGGVEVGEAAAWLRRYGPDTMLLIGGSLLAEDDLVAATRRLVDTAVSGGRQ